VGSRRPGRFAVFYVRAKEFRAPFEANVDVDGQLVKVAFGLGGGQVRRAQGWAMILLVLVLVGGGARDRDRLGDGRTNPIGDATGRRREAWRQKLAAAQAYRRQIAQATTCARRSGGLGRSVT